MFNTRLKLSCIFESDLKIQNLYYQGKGKKLFILLMKTHATLLYGNVGAKTWKLYLGRKRK